MTQTALCSCNHHSTVKTVQVTPPSKVLKRGVVQGGGPCGEVMEAKKAREAEQPPVAVEAGSVTSLIFSLT